MVNVVVRLDIIQLKESVLNVYGIKSMIKDLESVEFLVIKIVFSIFQSENVYVFLNISRCLMVNVRNVLFTQLTTTSLRNVSVMMDG